MTALMTAINSKSARRCASNFGKGETFIRSAFTEIPKAYMILNFVVVQSESEIIIQRTN